VTVECLRAPAPAWAWAALAFAVALMWRARRGLEAGAALAALVSAAVLLGGLDTARAVERDWPALREARVTAASLALRSTLSDAVTTARRLAERGAVAALRPPEEALARLGAAVDRQPEQGVAVILRDGTLWAWAGRHRLAPELAGVPEVRLRMTPYYAVVEARRQAANDATAIGSVLLAAAPPVADRQASVASAFERETGVALAFFAPGTEPDAPDVFDFCLASCPLGGDTLLSVQAVPPAQGTVQLAARRETAALSIGLLALVIALLFLSARPGPAWVRWAVTVAVTWALVRVPGAEGLGATPWLSPTTYFSGLLGPFSSSGTALAATAVLAFLLAAALWRRGLPRTRLGMAAAFFLVVLSPYALRHLGRGITPPATGVSFSLWLAWELSLATVVMALLVGAAALVRGREPPARAPVLLGAGVGGAIALGLVGLWLWEPFVAWPDWYTGAWVPVLVLSVLPAPRRTALVSIAVVAGIAAGLVTWGAVVEGRLKLARFDVEGRLGRQDDPVAVGFLDQLGRRVTSPGAAAPATAADLYALWQASPLGRNAYPAALAVWTPTRNVRAELNLAAVDVPRGLALAAAETARQRRALVLERYERVPGIHYVLGAPLRSGDVLTVSVGPQTRLLAPDRVAQFLHGGPGNDPPYRLELSLPAAEPPEGMGRGFTWRREGWEAWGERFIDLPGGVRHVHARVSLHGLWPTLIRGGLVVLLDVAVLVLLWSVGEVLERGGAHAGREGEAGFPWVRLRQSYRGRLAATLGAAFALPLLAFGVWSFDRLGDEVRRAGDLLVRQTLRDASASAEEIAADLATGGSGSSAEGAVVDLGRRLGVDLWLFSGGRLIAASAPVLSELGLVDPLLPPDVYRRVGLQDEIEAAADGSTAGNDVRIGYRTVRGGAPAEQVVLAAPQLLDDEEVRDQQTDLALTLALAIVIGLAVAVGTADLAARTLARPVAALTRAAAAVGRGDLAVEFPPGAPLEFEPVMTGFTRMARDVRRSREALEEARTRTAAVLANVATGVIAVDDGLRVTIANHRAEELLSASLEPGDVIDQATTRDWAPVWATVREFVAGGHDAEPEAEFEIGLRRVRVQLARLVPAPDGCVIALDDTTELTRVQRVLAWGEMARQVAHEIKNPLTPIRLGIQHLERVYRGAGAFGTTLRTTSERILAEIDRLDSIARAFSRFGAPAAEAPPLEAVDLLAVTREVLHLYALGDHPTRFALEEPTDGALRVQARKDEVKEVLVNLLENARNAGAKSVTVSLARGAVHVRDDGRGIPADQLPRIFEPRFSTTSSGAGLGLAIAKRLVEGWGGEIGVQSEPGKGTTVTVRVSPL
jgi:signal transduction histidine kinase